MKPFLQMFPERLILHIGTNDLTSSKSSQEIANLIINLICQLKSKSHNISLSRITLRADDTKLNKKKEVNSHLKEYCNEKIVYLIDNSKRSKS